MTPFGIRKKLKSILGLQGSQPSTTTAQPEVNRYTVGFETPDGEQFTAQAKEGDTLVFASNRGPKPIATGCADGTCGTCQVEVLSSPDQLTPETDHERNTKKLNKVDREMRLGCQTGVLGEGVRVRITNVLGEELR